MVVNSEYSEGANISQSSTRTLAAERSRFARNKRRYSFRLLPLVKLSKRKKAKVTRYAIITANVAIIAAVAALAAIHFMPNDTVYMSQQPRLTALANKSQDQAALTSPIDKTSSVDVALQLARIAGMQEQIAITNTSDSDRSLQQMGGDNAISLASSPQIFSADFVSSKDIKTYEVKPGDSVSSIAKHFGITSDSLRWSNDLSGDYVVVGKKLAIPPINGIVYSVRDGDTTDSLAKYYSVDEQKLIAYNDAEIDGIKAGQRILIPDGKKPSPRTYSYAGYYGFAFGGSAIYGYNGYIPGYCTYYVASKVSVPANWGDAYRWLSGSRYTSGWSDSASPRAGAIAYGPISARWGGLGHVAYVEAVSSDGTMIKFSDMNNLAGYNRVGYSDWVPASTFDRYIFRN